MKGIKISSKPAEIDKIRLGHCPPQGQKFHPFFKILEIFSKNDSHLFYPVRKPRCLPRAKLSFYRGLQRGGRYNSLRARGLLERTRGLMPRVSLPVGKSKTS